MGLSLAYSESYGGHLAFHSTALCQSIGSPKSKKSVDEFFTLVVLLFLSGLFSGSETALVSISIARVEGLLKEGRKGANALLELKRNPHRMLITILIGNNLVNIAASAIATVIATERLGALGPGIAVGTLTILILIFGEVTPKSLATRYSERISLLVAAPMLTLMRVMYPAVWVFEQCTTWVHHRFGIENEPTITESELISMVTHGEEEGIIESDERQFIERVFEFDELHAKDVMTPRQQIFALDGSCSIAEVLSGSHSRIPVYAKNPDEIRKVVHLRDILEAVAAGHTQATLNEIAHEPIFIPQNQPIDELFAMLRRKKQHMAVVVDEYGVLRGLVTLEDLLEELVGEIYDESDVTPQQLAVLDEDKIAVDGAAELRLVEEFFDVDLSGKPTDTVSLWILSYTERIPEVGEHFTIDGLDVIVEKASSSHIRQVILTLPQVSVSAATDSPVDTKNANS
jgi:putative hemolysin